MNLKAIKEKRFITVNGEGLNIRSSESEAGQRYIEGYAALFDHESKILAEKRNGEYEWFTEFIERGAFDEALASPDLNVIHTIDHDRSKMVARTISKTLELSVDDKGLKYRFSVPNTTVGNDLFELVSRGDVFESSFVFTVDKQNERWDDSIHPKKRYITKVSGLYDTSSVTDGAYSNTAVKVARFLAEPEVEEPVVEAVKAETKTEEINNDLDLLTLDLEIFGAE